MSAAFSSDQRFIRQTARAYVSSIRLPSGEYALYLRLRPVVGCSVTLVEAHEAMLPAKSPVAALINPMCNARLRDISLNMATLALAVRVISTG